jgi:hypothetical protein
MQVYTTLHPNPFLYNEKEEKIYYKLQRVLLDLEELEKTIESSDDSKLSELSDEISIHMERFERYQNEYVSLQKDSCQEYPKNEYDTICPINYNEILEYDELPILEYSESPILEYDNKQYDEHNNEHNDKHNDEQYDEQGYDVDFDAYNDHYTLY